MATSFPMIAPDGSTAQVPADQVAVARAKGAQHAIHMQGPDGSLAWVPAGASAQVAIRKGAKPVPAAPVSPPPNPTGLANLELSRQGIGPVAPPARPSTSIDFPRQPGPVLGSTMPESATRFSDAAGAKAAEYGQGFVNSLKDSSDSPHVTGDPNIDDIIQMAKGGAQAVHSGIVDPLRRAIVDRDVPGALGEGAVSVPMSEEAIRGMVKPVMAGAQSAASAAGPAIRRATQEALNVGPSLTERTEGQIGAANTEMARIHTERLKQFQQDAATTRAGDRATYESQLSDIRRQNAAEAAEHQQQVSQIRAMNTERQAAHQAQVDAVNSANESQRAQVAQRAQLNNDLTDHGTQAAINLKVLEDAVRRQGGGMFDNVRAATEGQVADPAALRAAVEHAQTKILAGSPENIKIFRSILGDTSGPEAVSSNMGTISPGTPLFDRLVSEGAIQAPEPLKWNDLQGYYTELGQQLGTKSLPSDVWRALKYVKDDGIGQQMGAMADRAGVAPQWTAARKFWTQYEQTFNDMRPVSQGGSPVARAFRAADPDAALTPFTRGPSGIRGIESLRVFGEGGNALADSIQQARAKWNQIQSLPKMAKESPVPKPPTLKPEPSAPIPAPEPPTAKLRSVGEPPTLKLQTVPDPVAVKQAAVQRIADYLRGEGGWRIWSDVVAGTGAASAALHGNPLAAAGFAAFPIARRGIGAAMERPGFLRWISKATPEEMRAVGSTPMMRTPPAPPTVTLPPGVSAPPPPPQ